MRLPPRARFRMPIPRRRKAVDPTSIMALRRSCGPWRMDAGYYSRDRSLALCMPSTRIKMARSCGRNNFHPVAYSAASSGDSQPMTSMSTFQFPMYGKLAARRARRAGSTHLISPTAANFGTPRRRNRIVSIVQAVMPANRRPPKVSRLRPRTGGHAREPFHDPHKYHDVDTASDQQRI